MENIEEIQNFINKHNLDDNEDYNRMVRYIAKFVGEMRTKWLDQKEIESILSVTSKQVVNKVFSE